MSSLVELCIAIALLLFGYHTTKCIVNLNQLEKLNFHYGDFNHFMSSKSVVLYTLNGCLACKEAKLFLNKHSIEHELREIPVDGAWPSELSKLGITSVPILIKQDVLIVGFLKEKYQEELL